jgi:uracil phosphoribosyltransferase
MVHNLSKSNSILNNYLAEIRDEVVQRDSMRFRRNMERLAEAIGFELSKTLIYEAKSVTTSLGVAEMNVMRSELVLATILRAGLPMHQGLLNCFDQADSAFISAYRKHKSGDEFDIYVEYCAAPSIDGKTLIISDPMLATGSSMVMVYKTLLKNGNPKQVHIVSAIATQEAIDAIEKHFPANVHVWVAAIDDELTAQAYIVPGLGDAGDLAFGDKL